MTKKCEVHSVEPGFAIPGGEILVKYEMSGISPAEIECVIDGLAAPITAASNTRLFARVPEDVQNEDAELTIVAGSEESEPVSFKVGTKLCDNMHIVSNPAVDPDDGSIILTRSGTRGQEIPNTLFRYRDGEVQEIAASVMNPTAVAFDSTGRLFVSNRADGEVVQINHDSEAVPLATDLGVATGLAFDKSGNLYVGDRGGMIYRVSGLGDARDWAELEASVSAYHLAFGPDGDLYVTAPGLCSHDVIHRITQDGSRTDFFKGLGRPQGLGFDDDGNLYVAACLRGRHGIVRISSDGKAAGLFLAGMSVVGLCFDREGKMIVATGDAVYSLDIGVYGTLL